MPGNFFKRLIFTQALTLYLRKHNPYQKLLINLESLSHTNISVIYLLTVMFDMIPHDVTIQTSKISKL